MTKLALIAAATIFLPFGAMAQGTPGGHFMENWDLDADGAVTIAEATERREMVFGMFDDDENGVLDAAEYANFDETRAADMANNAGGHGNGGHRMQEGLTLPFNDLDADGRVTKQEFLAQTAAWIAQVDRNADGAVTAADFGPQSN